jgi:urea transporter
MSELVIRFLVGGLIVSLFAMLSDALRPKSFAGLFGAAPSIALATLGLTVLKNGRAYAAAESRSMMLGALAFLTYAATVSWALRRYRVSALGASMVLLPLWFLVSFCLWRLVGAA